MDAAKARASGQGLQCVQLARGCKETGKRERLRVVSGRPSTLASDRPHRSEGRRNGHASHMEASGGCAHQTSRTMRATAGPTAARRRGASRPWCRWRIASKGPSGRANDAGARWATDFCDSVSLLIYSTACLRFHSAAVRSASSSFVFQCSATSLASGSSGFGADSRA